MPFEQKINGIVTERTDVYALGVLLFEILSPLRFSSSDFASPYDKSREKIHKFLKQNCAFVPKYVSKIIHKATKDNELERYNNVQEIIDEIEKGDPWYKQFLS